MWKKIKRQNHWTKGKHVRNISGKLLFDLVLINLVWMNIILTRAHELAS